MLPGIIVSTIQSWSRHLRGLTRMTMVVSPRTSWRKSSRTWEWSPQRKNWIPSWSRSTQMVRIDQSHKHFCSEWCIVRYMNLVYSAVYWYWFRFWNTVNLAVWKYMLDMLLNQSIVIYYNPWPLSSHSIVLLSTWVYNKILTVQSPGCLRLMKN